VRRLEEENLEYRIVDLARERASKKSKIKN